MGDARTTGDLAGPVRVRVAAVNDFETVVQGLARVLGRFPEDLCVVDGVTVGEPIAEPVDVAVYDTFGQPAIEGPLGWLRSQAGVERIAVLSRSTGEAVVERAERAGATGFLAKGLGAAELARGVRRVAAGEAVRPLGGHPAGVGADLDWPGRSAGLSERESEVCALAADGLSNGEIAAVLAIGRETVKTHLSAVYRKLGTRNRVQIAGWVQREPDFRRYSVGALP